MRFVVLLSLLGLMAFAGCGPANTNNDKPAPDPKAPAVDPPKSGKSEPPSAEVAALIESLKKVESRDGAIARLKSKGAAVVPGLINVLEKETGDARQPILVAIGAIGKDAAAALPALKRIVASEKDPAILTTAQFTIDAIEGN